MAISHQVSDVNKRLIVKVLGCRIQINNVDSSPSENDNLNIGDWEKT